MNNGWFSAEAAVRALAFERLLSTRSRRSGIQKPMSDHRQEASFLTCQFSGALLLLVRAKRNSGFSCCPAAKVCI